MVSASARSMFIEPMDLLGFVYSSNCPATKPFIQVQTVKGLKEELGECVGCDYGMTMNIAEGYEKDFDRCPNRITIRGNSYLKKKCPPEKPLQTTSGKCISCDQLEGDIIQDCSICSGSIDILGRCYKCDYPNPFPSTEENCSKCSERKYKDGSCFAKLCPEGYFMLEDGKCFYLKEATLKIKENK